MKPEEILENNKLVAEFMGWAWVPTKFEEESEAIRVPGHYERGHDWHDENFNYHLSFDDLMPVVEKIETIGHYSVEIVGAKTTIEDGKWMLDNHFNYMYIDPSGCKIASIYKVVVRFIQFYNTFST